jgi:Zn-dependent protease/CBS domain-containing protein
VKGSLRVARIFGIPIKIHFSWVLVFALVTLSLAAAYFPVRSPGWSTSAYVGMGVVTSLLFFASVLVHELAHSVVAMAWKIRVESITLFIFGGVAHISREPDRPLAEFLIALAGPVSSLLLALGFGVLWLVGQSLALAPLADVGLYLGTINLWLALFNMIPGFPLDGGRVFRSIVWAWTGNLYRATHWAANSGRLMAFLMIAGGAIFFFTGNWASGVWLAFIGWYLEGTASTSRQQARLQQALDGLTAGDLAASVCQPVPGTTPLDWLVRDRVMTEGESCFLITDGETPAGLATLSQIRQVPGPRWAWTPVRQIMTSFDHVQPIQATETAFDALQRLLTEEQSLLPVVDGGRFIGLVGRDRLLNLAQARASVGA